MIYGLLNRNWRDYDLRQSTAGECSDDSFEVNDFSGRSFSVTMVTNIFRRNRFFPINSILPAPTCLNINIKIMYTKLLSKDIGLCLLLELQSKQVRCCLSTDYAFYMNTPH
jgi:hypothetical protein